MRSCVQCRTGHLDGNWHCHACGYQPNVKPTYTSFVSGDASQEDGFEAHFFEQLANLEPGFWWFEARNDMIIDAMRRWFPRARSFLEIGCGTGFVVSRIAHDMQPLKTSASELFPEAMEFVSARAPRTELYQMDARHIPFRDEFDVIGAFDVIEHIDEDTTVMREVAQALTPGGGVILTVPQHPFLWTNIDEHSHHKRRYTRSSMKRLLAEAGLELLHLQSFVTLLFPLLILSRLRNRRADSSELGNEFAISPFANRLIRSIMRMERALGSRGVSFPFGGSLLAVARKRPA